MEICNERTYKTSSSSTSCTNCPLNRYNCQGTSQGTRCSSSTTQWRDIYSPQNSCEDCPAGYSCDNYALDSACTEGFYSENGDAACSLCGVNKICSTTAEIGNCPDGTYSLEGRSSCSPCPVGYQCSGTNVSPCASGTYSPMGQSSCQTCPSDSICNGKTLPIKCPPGKTPNGLECVTDPAVAAEVKCKLGWVCPNDNDPYPCPPGTYSNNGDSCDQCPTGSYCPFPELAQGLTCENGYFAPNQGMTECWPCPAGYQCDSRSKTQCASRQYSLMYDTTCHDCPRGFICADGKDYTQCPDGTFSDPDSDICQECQPDNFCINGVQAACEDGLVSQQGSSLCELCPSGYQCDGTSETFSQCNSGTYSPLGETTCLTCPPGYYCPTGGGFSSDHLKICPMGQFCIAGRSEPENCPINTYGGSLGLQSSAGCTTCPAGYHCHVGTAGFPTHQHLCPLGHYCEGGQAPVPCEAGTYGALHGLTSQAQCQPCQPGQYCQAGSTHGQPCPPGHFCPQSRQEAPTLCPPGTYNTGSGARDSSKCRNCPAGHFCCDGSGDEWVQDGTCVGATVYPKECPAGSFQDRNGQFNCDYCPPGKLCTIPGLDEPDSDCAYGHFCPLGSIESVPCPAGTYLDYNNGTTYDDCFDCPAGYYCGEGTTYNTAYADDGTEIDASPIVCPVGHYCVERTPEATTYPCPAGTYNDIIGIKHSNECTNCTEGYFCPRGLGYEPSSQSVPDLTCPEGKFCPEGTPGVDENDARIPSCPAGTFLEERGKWRVEDCKECPQGEFCNAGTDEAATCPDGTYSDSFGIGSVTDCVTCPAGYKCDTTAGPVLAPVPCGAGFHSAPGATDCDTCKKGHYCDLNTTSTEAMLYFKVCPEGTFCDESTDVIPDLVSHQCPLGKWCMKGDVKAYGGEPQNCPRGTYGPHTGLVNRYECEKCPAGYFCDEEGSKCPTRTYGDADCDWKLCEPGNYCELGSSEQKECGPGFYRSASDGYYNAGNPNPNPDANQVQAAVNQTSCSLCESGHYCPDSGREIPIPCPVGNYCPPGSVRPEKCDAGTYLDETEARTSQECKPCTAGYYCPTRGMERAPEIDETGADTDALKCSAGYYCEAGSRIQNPNKCPAGFYCDLGSDRPKLCDPGTFTPFSGAESDSDCTQCYPGFNCPGSADSLAKLPCQAGFYCPGGNPATGEPTPCTAGHYCPQRPLEAELSDGTVVTLSELIGAIHPIQCDAGYFSPSEGRSECDECSAGSFCPLQGMEVTIDCPRGHYCPRGSIFPEACPVGTYNAESSQPSLTNCQDCPIGNYCPSRGMYQPILCPDGYYCNQAGIINPFDTDATTYQCEPGSVCYSDADGAHQDQCPAGSYNPRSHGHQDSDCLECPPGLACLQPGIFSEADMSAISVGYYSKGGADKTRPSGPTGKVQTCGFGYYCPEGSADQIPCPSGQYDQSAEGAGECSRCTDGRYCTGTINIPGEDDSTGRNNPNGAERICPKGSYCQAAAACNDPGNCSEEEIREEIRTASRHQLCSKGSYNSLLATSDPNCTPCDQGRVAK